MLDTIPVGALLFAFCTLMAVAPVRHPRWAATLAWLSSCAPNEVPFLFVYIVAATSVGPTLAGSDLSSLDESFELMIGLLTIAGLGLVAWRAGRARPILEAATRSTLGDRWRDEIDPSLRSRLRRRRPWWRILLMPFPVRPRRVERDSNIPYGEHGKANWLDVYRHRSHPSAAPTLLHFHGGRFRWGNKSREARPLLHHLAGHGWTCISANYRLAASPGAGFPEHLIDVKRVISWARANAQEYGIDPDSIFLSGSSAGAHLAAMAALTSNDRRFQPGFEADDTSIQGAVAFYGYYGSLRDDDEPQPPSTPLAYDATNAPPFLVVHGDNDTYTFLEGARAFVDHLRRTATNPVVFAELRGAQHSFDLFHSVRYEAVVDAVEAFAAWVRTNDQRPADLSDVRGLS